MRKFWLFILFLIPLSFMFFQLQILGHEIYHFTKNSPYSTAICIDRDLRTNIVAYTISDAGADYRIIGKNSGPVEGKTFLMYDINEERTADLLGYVVAMIGTIFILLWFYVIIKKM